MAETTRPEPISDAVHLCIDMQNIFFRGGIWETPWMERVLPAIVDITARYTARTIFTRFITPLRALSALPPAASCDTQPLTFEVACGDRGLDLDAQAEEAIGRPDHSRDQFGWA